MFVLKSCDFQAGAAADQGGIEPATAGLRKQARKTRDNFQNSFCERERSDTHDLRRGFAETKKNSHDATARALRHARSPQRGVFAPRPRRSPQRVAREYQTTQNTSIFCASTTPISAEGRAGISKNPKKTSSFCTSTTPIPAERRAGTDKNAKKKLEFLHLDHADLRRGSRGHIKKRQKKNIEFLHLDHADPEGRIPDRRQHPHPPPSKRFLIPSSFSFFPAH